MTNERVCRCLLEKADKKEILEDINRRIEKLSPNEKAGEELYKNRLSLCSDCDYIADGTCLKCGCYPEFRAAFLKNKCPVKKW